MRPLSNREEDTSKNGERDRSYFEYVYSIPFEGGSPLCGDRS